MKILLISNNLHYLKNVRRILMRMGYICHSINDFMKVKDSLNENSYEIVIFDAELLQPEDYHYLLSFEKEKRKESFILLISKRKKDKMEMDIEKLFSNILAKPLDLDELITYIEKKIDNI